MRALRGATTIEVDERDHVLERTRELIEVVLESNGLDHGDLISIVFTATDDVMSVYPAEAARQLGIVDTPLLCARELDVEGGMDRCVRLLAHVHTTLEPRELKHAYLHDAVRLRTDLAG